MYTPSTHQFLHLLNFTNINFLDSVIQILSRANIKTLTHKSIDKDATYFKQDHYCLTHVDLEQILKSTIGFHKTEISSGKSNVLDNAGSLLLTSVFGVLNQNLGDSSIRKPTSRNFI